MYDKLSEPGMYCKLPNLIVGFHGCSKKVFDAVIRHGEALKESDNDYDWLGHGIYFWEQSYLRAYEWAKTHNKNGEPSVVGAIIDLGECLNLTDLSSSDVLKRGYQILKIRCESLGVELPQNVPSQKTNDILKRNLDCAVIQQIHDFNRKIKNCTYDSVRGVFWEGKEVYPGSCFLEKTHIQLCVVNPNCIKGYFNPRSPDKNYRIP